MAIIKIWLGAQIFKGELAEEIWEMRSYQVWQLEIEIFFSVGQNGLRHNIQRKMRKSCPWRKDAFQMETLQYIHFHLLSFTNC